MDFGDEEILRLFRLFQKYEVKYLVIGGFAVNIHGYDRFTEDLDLWIKDELGNRKQLRSALEEMLHLELPEIERMQFIPGWSIVKLPSGFPLDIMSQVKGLDHYGFDSCLEQAQYVRLDGVTIPFLHYRHLIEGKTATARPKDQLDIAELRKIHNE